MQITISETEAAALMQLKSMLKNSPTPVPEFLYWIAARLVNEYKESPNVDFVQALTKHADDLRYISIQLEIHR